MTKHGFRQWVVLLTLAALGTQALAAQKPTLPEEKTGAVVGGLIGAGFGGPIGAVAGMIIGGGWIGRTVGIDRINGDLRHTLAQERMENRNQQATLRTEIAQLGRALNKADLAEQATDKLDVPIHFATGSSAIAAHYRPDLLDIARTLAGRQDVRIDLSGYADRRGASTYNQKLSETRVQEVKTFLVQHGVAEDQIKTRAFGESRPVDKVETPQGDFIDRRVVMHFALQGEQNPVAVR